MTEDERPPESPPSGRAAVWRRRLLFSSPVIVAGLILGLIVSSCVPARAAAAAFLTALHDGHIDDARALATGPIQLHLGLEPPVATPPIDPPRTIAFIRAAQRVEIDGITQSGCNNDSQLFVCFDAKLDDAARFWIVMRKLNGAWLVEMLASDEPEVCRGSD